MESKKVSFVLLIILATTASIKALVDTAVSDGISEHHSNETNDEIQDKLEPDPEFLELLELKSFWTSFDVDEDVKFYLYMRKHRRQELRANLKSFKKSKFNKNLPTRFVVHGWKNNYRNLLEIKDAYMQQGEFNCIMVDWSLGADDNIYVTSRFQVEDVGKVISNFIEFMFQQGYADSKNVHIVGHSLGAHIAGFAGKFLKVFQIPVIVGLDPADPMFDVDDAGDRIDKQDGAYVAIIHTSPVGIDEAIGHADFYVNYGYAQPGCGFDILSVCSHNRVIEIFAESIYSRKFKAIMCKDAKQIYEHNRCDKMNKEEIMTTEAKDKPTGIFLVHTHSDSPYAKG